MRIRMLFILGFCLVAIPGLVASLWLAAGTARDLARIAAAEQDLRTVSDAQRTVSAIALEIGSMSSVLRQATPDRAQMASDAAISDRLLADTATSAGIAGYDLALLRGIVRDVAAIRQRVDQDLAKPLAQRDQTLAPTTTQLRNQFVEGLMALAGQATRAAGKRAPDIALLIETSNSVLDMRNSAGRRNAQLSAWVAGVPVQAAALSTVDQLTGQLEQAWSDAQRLLASAPSSPRLAAALAKQHEVYAARNEVRWQAEIGVARQRVGQPATPWTAELAEYRAWSRDAQSSMLELRDAALDEALILAGENRDTALNNLALALLLAALCFVAALGGAMLLLRRLVTPIRAMTSVLSSIAGGNLSLEVPGKARTDEIGEMAQAVETLRAASAERLAESEARDHEQAQRIARAERVDSLLRGFETEIASMLEGVASAATELDATAGSMSGIAANGTTHALSVADAAREASVNVETVAAAAEELAASFAEVTRQIRDGSERTQAATSAAGEAGRTVRSLTEAADRIGAVVQLITDIAGQTNLLALNATIEAARAGDAGKGFAVVANEVKALAAQTAKATDEISGQIAAMQTETRRTVEAIADIARIIEGVGEATAQISETAGQQAKATQEIGQAVSEAARGTAAASSHASGVSEDAERTGEAAGAVRSASADLAGRAEMLRGQVGRFLGAIRAA